MSVAYIKQIVPSSTTNDVISTVQYSGTWYLNTTSLVTNGTDRTFTPSQFSLDTSLGNLNINATSLLNTSTSYFAITAPVSGLYTFVWNSRGFTGSIPATSCQDVWTYLAYHVLNGNTVSSLGTAPNCGYRPGMIQTTYSNPTSSTLNAIFHQTSSCTLDLIKGDVVAPWMGGAMGGGSTTGGALSGGTSAGASCVKLSVALVRQTY